MTSQTCTACGAAARACRQDCPEERQRQAHTRREAERARERREDRADGVAFFPSVAAFIRWGFAERERRGSARALPLSSRDMSSGPPSTGQVLASDLTYAAWIWAIKIGAEDERASLGKAPVARWLEDHHWRGRSYDTLAEWSDGRWSIDQIKRRLGRAHAVIGERAALRGVCTGKEPAA